MVQIPFDDFPPHPYVSLLAQHYPRAIHNYIELWKRRDKSGRITVPKAGCQAEHLASFTKLRNDMLLVVSEGLASLKDIEGGFLIEFVGFDKTAVSAEGRALC